MAQHQRFQAFVDDERSRPLHERGGKPWREALQERLVLAYLLQVSGSDLDAIEMLVRLGEQPQSQVTAACQRLFRRWQVWQATTGIAGSVIGRG